MKESPLIMTGHSVRQILAGAKTQTRRLLPRPTVKTVAGLRIETGCDACWKAAVPHNGDAAVLGGPCYLRVPACDHVDSDGYPGGGRIGPRWNVGDRIWIKEGVCENYFGDAHEGTSGHAYRADWTKEAADFCREPRWISSRYMPRRLSRLTLEVTEVRVERLQSITEDDARAEGVETGKMPPAIVNGERGSVMIFDQRKAFAVLWDSINGKKAPWSSNPWLWCVSFRRLA